MCTIGAVLGKSLLLFKNRDLKHKKPNPEPCVYEGTYKYIGFGREKGAGVWAGINEKGIGLVASDAHTAKKYPSPKNASELVFGTYAQVLSEAKSVSAAKKLLVDFYETLKVPDIVLVAGKKKALVIEYTPEGTRFDSISSGFIVRTNHFLLAPGAKPKEKDPDTYARYGRAVELLSENSSLEGVKNLCRDHANGPSLNSVCRHSENNYNTIYSAIMVSSENVSAHYVANGYPCMGGYKTVSLG